MLTKEEVNTFIELEKKIQDTCDHIATFFKDFDCDFEEPTYWDWDDGAFRGTGCSIGPEWLSATDEELRQHVNDILEQRRLWREARELEAKLERERREQEKKDWREKVQNMSREELIKLVLS